MVISSLTTSILNAAPRGLLLADSTTPASNPSGTSTTVVSAVDSVDALPGWLLVSLVVLVAAIIVGMFALTFYNLSAPRSTLKNLLGTKGKGILRKQPAHPAPPPLTQLSAQIGAQGSPLLNARVLDTLNSASTLGKRVTRSLLAITGFAFVGVIVIAVFGLSGTGVRDLRSQVVAAIATLVASIAGFYFGTASADSTQAAPAAAVTTAPSISGPTDQGAAVFRVGTNGAFIPMLSGTPAPSVTVTGMLPPALTFDPKTGVISGTPAAGADTGGPHGGSTYPIVLTADNGVSPIASLTVTITVLP